MVGALLKAAQGGDVELQVGGDGDVKPKPGHGDCTKNVSVGERDHAAAGSLTQVDELKRTRIDLGRSLTAWTSVFEQLPAPPSFVNLPGGDPFILAVIEFAEERRQLRIGETGDLGGAPGPLKWAGKHSVEGRSAEPRA